jgi:hypothetical protein
MRPALGRLAFKGILDAPAALDSAPLRFTESSFASWTAPAKHSDGGAFARTHELRAFENRCPHESGVALPAAVHDAPRNSDALERKKGF